MKKRTKTPINRPLFPSIKEVSDGLNKKNNPVISIKTNVCFEKNDCPLCTFHPYYGVELTFILYYANKSIQTVCYKCGKRIAEETGLKLPMTLTEIEYIEGVEDRALI
jgi:hypothetical protein